MYFVIFRHSTHPKPATRTVQCQSQHLKCGSWIEHRPMLCSETMPAGCLPSDSAGSDSSSSRTSSPNPSQNALILSPLQLPKWTQNRSSSPCAAPFLALHLTAVIRPWSRLSEIDQTLRSLRSHHCEHEACQACQACRRPCLASRIRIGRSQQSHRRPIRSEVRGCKPVWSNSNQLEHG